MEGRFPVEKGHLTCQRQGERVRLCLAVPGKGLCRGKLLGERGSLDLGPLIPQGECLCLERSFLVSTLEKQGCWPITGAQLVRPPKNPAASTPKGWSRELGAELLFQDPLLAQTIQNAPRPLVRPRPEGFQLAWPWNAEEPFPLPPLFCFAHVIPGKYMPCGTMQAAGSSYAYIRRALCGGAPYEELNQMVEKSPVGAKNLIFLPYLLGERSPRWNPDTSGAFLGIKPEHEKKDYVRAVLEGIAMNMELILKAYRRQAKIEDMCLTGGGAKGDVTAQILADVLNVEFRMPDCVEEATAIGAAVIAGVGVGVFDSFEEVKRFLKFEKTVKPVEEHREDYKKLMPIFDEAYHCMLPLYKKMAKL